MPVDRRQLLLGGVGAIVLVIAAWTFWPSAATAPVTAAPKTAARGARAASADTTPEPVAAVKLKELMLARDEPGEAARNPFRFQPKVVAPPPRPVVTQPPVIDTTPRPPAPPPGPPPAPPIPLKFIGILERQNGVKWAVLTDGKGSPMYGKDGDIIDGRYVIVKIGTESIEMTHADGRGRQVIRLTGQ
jgi:hypothetical protein